MSSLGTIHRLTLEKLKSEQSPDSRLVFWSLPPPIRPPAIHLPGWKSMNGQENLWLSAFVFFFQPFYSLYRHVWTLQPTEQIPLSHGRHVRWYNVVYFAKVRFDCEKCRRRWTSFKGRVVFWFGLHVHEDRTYHRVLFKITGQQCLHCVRSPEGKNYFLTALWYPDEIEASVRLLTMRVIENFYLGLLFTTKSVSPSRRLELKAERKKNSLFFHDYNRCQACRLGDRCK